LIPVLSIEVFRRDADNSLLEFTLKPSDCKLEISINYIIGGRGKKLAWKELTTSPHLPLSNKLLSAFLPLTKGEELAGCRRIKSPAPSGRGRIEKRYLLNMDG
jgi:hypothetical protein